MTLALVSEPKRTYNLPNNKHDSGYKYLLSDKSVFLQLLQSFVQEKWVQHINADNIIRVDKSFILPDFQNREADLVYRIALADRDVIFYLLLELQATVDFTMPFRLLLYMVEIWRSLLHSEGKNITGKDFRLPLIVPCVLYNGRSNWTACRSFGQYQAGFELFSEHALDFNYLLIDINRYEQESLLKMHNLISTVFFIEQQKGFTELIHGLKEVAATLTQLPKRDVHKFSTWVGKVFAKELPHEQQKHLAKLLASNSGEVETMISNVERIIRETRISERTLGIAEGEAKGMLLGKRQAARNALKMGLSVKQTAGVTELPLAEVEALKLELSN